MLNLVPLTDENPNYKIPDGRAFGKEEQYLYDNIFS